MASQNVSRNIWDILNYSDTGDSCNSSVSSVADSFTRSGRDIEEDHSTSSVTLQKSSTSVIGNGSMYSSERNKDVLRKRSTAITKSVNNVSSRASKRKGSELEDQISDSHVQLCKRLRLPTQLIPRKDEKTKIISSTDEAKAARNHGCTVLRNKQPVTMLSSLQITSSASESRMTDIVDSDVNCCASVRSSSCTLLDTQDFPNSAEFTTLRSLSLSSHVSSTGSALYGRSCVTSRDMRIRSNEMKMGKKISTVRPYMPENVVTTEEIQCCNGSSDILLNNQSTELANAAGDAKQSHLCCDNGLSESTTDLGGSNRSANEAVSPMLTRRSLVTYSYSEESSRCSTVVQGMATTGCKDKRIPLAEVHPHRIVPVTASLVSKSSDSVGTASLQASCANSNSLIQPGSADNPHIENINATDYSKARSNGKEKSSNFSRSFFDCLVESTSSSYDNTNASCLQHVDKDCIGTLRLSDLGHIKTEIEEVKPEVTIVNTTVAKPVQIMSASVDNSRVRRRTFSSFLASANKQSSKREASSTANITNNNNIISSRATSALTDDLKLSANKVAPSTKHHSCEAQSSVIRSGSLQERQLDNSTGADLELQEKTKSKRRVNKRKQNYTQHQKRQAPVKGGDVSGALVNDLSSRTCNNYVKVNGRQKNTDVSRDVDNNKLTRDRKGLFGRPQRGLTGKTNQAAFELCSDFANEVYNRETLNRKIHHFSDAFNYDAWKFPSVRHDFISTTSFYSAMVSKQSFLVCRDGPENCSTPSKTPESKHRQAQIDLNSKINSVEITPPPHADHLYSKPSTSVDSMHCESNRASFEKSIEAGNLSSSSTINDSSTLINVSTSGIKKQLTFCDKPRLISDSATLAGDERLDGQCHNDSVPAVQKTVASEAKTKSKVSLEVLQGKSVSSVNVNSASGYSTRNQSKKLSQNAKSTNRFIPCSDETVIIVEDEESAECNLKQSQSEKLPQNRKRSNVPYEEQSLEYTDEHSTSGYSTRNQPKKLSQNHNRSNISSNEELVACIDKYSVELNSSQNQPRKLSQHPKKSNPPSSDKYSVPDAPERPSVLRNNRIRSSRQSVGEIENKAAAATGNKRGDFLQNRSVNKKSNVSQRSTTTTGSEKNNVSQRSTTTTGSEKSNVSQRSTATTGSEKSNVSQRSTSTTGSEKKFGKVKKPASSSRMLKELRNSDHYVAERNIGNRRSHDTLLVDSDLLSREERSLQMALMRFSQMESEAAFRPCPKPKKVTNSRQKANALMKKAHSCCSNKARATLLRSTVAKKAEKVKDEHQIDNKKTTQIPDAANSSLKNQQQAHSKGNISPSVHNSRATTSSHKSSNKRAKISKEERQQYQLLKIMVPINVSSKSKSVNGCSRNVKKEELHNIKQEHETKENTSRKRSLPCKETGKLKNRSRAVVKSEVKECKVESTKESQPKLSVKVEQMSASKLKAGSGMSPHSDSFSQKPLLTLSSSSCDTNEGSRSGDSLPATGVTLPKHLLPLEVRRLVYCPTTGESVLHKAARLGYEEIVLWCCQTGYVDINALDHAGFSPLHEACFGSHLSIARYLLHYGSHVNPASFMNGIRPIHTAVDTDDLPVVRLLLSHGADIEPYPGSGRTVHSIARSVVMKTFLRAYLVDRYGDTNRDAETEWDVAPDWTGNPDASDILADLPDDDDCGKSGIVFEMNEYQYHITSTTRESVD